MKAKNIFLRAAFAVMVAVVGSSCNKWDDSFHGLPDYSYFKTGIYESSFTEDLSSAKKTDFEYRVWAEAATKMQRAEITLQATLKNITNEVIVNSFNLGNNRSYIVSKSINSRRDQDIIVTDSLMTYRIIYENGLTLDYEMPFQSAFYNDGKTAGQMAHLCFENEIINNDYTLTDLDSEVIDGVVYMRKLFRHSIEVRFNGSLYKASALVVLKKGIGNEGEIYLTQSTLLDSGIEDLINEGNYASYKSWIKVKQTFSDGHSEEVMFDVAMYGKMEIMPFSDMNITGTELVRESADFDESREHIQTISRNEYVSASYHERYYIVSYNYGKTETLFQHVEAVYNDGYNVFEFPCIKYEYIKNNGVLNLISEGEDVHGEYAEYEFAQWVHGSFGTVGHDERKTQRVMIML